MIEIIGQAVICDMIHPISTFTRITIVQVEIFRNFWKIPNVHDNDSIVTVQRDLMVQVQYFWHEMQEQILIQKLQETLKKIEMMESYIHFQLVMYLIQNSNKLKCTDTIIFTYYIMHGGNINSVINSVIMNSFVVADGSTSRDEETKETCDEFLFDSGDDFALFCLCFCCCY